MATFSLNFEIKEDSKKDDVLTDEFKNNAMGTFGKLLMDYLLEGNDVRLTNASTQETIETTVEDVIVVDEEGKETTVKQENKKDVYNITVNIQVEKAIVNGSKKCVRRLNYSPTIESNKLVMTQSTIKEGSIISSSKKEE